jgi:class 3 adenylate cyclase
MATTHDQQIQQEIIKLERAIAGLEAQRQVMGDEIVETSLVSLREKLANLSGVREPPQQQRKLATILFLDVVSSTRLGQHLEPDEVLELMDGALKRLAAPVEAHGGHVTRFLGDGFKAVFGVPAGAYTHLFVGRFRSITSRKSRNDLLYTYQLVVYRVSCKNSIRQI